MGKGKRVRRTVNYGDAERGGADGDGSWQENMSDYNSDFSMPSDDEQGNNIVKKFSFSIYLLQVDDVKIDCLNLF